MKFKLEKCNNPLITQDINTLLQLPDLDCIIRAWVNETRSLVIISSSDDNTGEPQVYILFEDKTFKGKDSEVACAYCDQAEILSAHPEIAKFIPPTLLRKAFDFETKSEIDQEFFKKRDALLKYEWSEPLQSDVCSPASAVYTAVGLALSGQGETTFSKPDLSFLFDDDEYKDDLEVYEEHFLWAHSCRGSVKSTMIECSDYYVDLRLLFCESLPITETARLS